MSTPASFLRHEAQSIRNKDARVRGPRLLDAIAKWYENGSLPKGFTFDECIDYCESQFDWASEMGWSTTAKVYRKVITDLWPYRKAS